MNLIEPTKQQTKTLLKLPKDQVIVMLNLLKFKEHTTDTNESGRITYERYVQNVLPLIQKDGGKLIFAGNAVHQLIATETDIKWDRVLMIQYPSPRNFIRMSSSNEYAAIHHDRAAGLEQTRLIVLHEDE